MNAPATTAPTTTPSWQARLAAKKRRRVTHPIQVSADAGDLVARVEQLRGMTRLLRDLPTTAPETRQQLEADLAEAEAEMAEHVVEVVFESLPPADYDALVAMHPSPTPGDDGGIAWRTALPALAAACCAEQDGGDETWWTEELAKPSWSPRDLLELWGALLRLHTRAPSARVPFA